MKLIKHKTTRNKIKKVLKILLSIVLLFAVCLNLFLIINYDVLPLKYLIVFILIFGIIPSLLIYLTNFRRQKKAKRIISITLEIIYIIILFIMFFYLNKTFDFLDNFTSSYDYETKNYYVLANKDDNYDKITDLDNTTIGYLSIFDETVDKAKTKVNNKIRVEYQELEDFYLMLENLNNSSIEGILILESYYETMCESEELNCDNIEVIYEFSIKEKVNQITKDSNVLKDTFYIYVSGIDTYGSVTEKTRSDVNILMGINPKSNQIMMINIPRDYYVTLHDINKKDKLTHAGIYGVETSQKTIEDLLGIQINYYIKVNFNAVIKLVDALGGIEVYSNHDFYSTETSHHFVKGYNKVNGTLALDFVRTRKAFLDGDRVRGENQEALISAIINKAASSAILTRYNDILDKLDGSFTTNMPADKIMDIVKMQLDKMPKWNILSIGLNGSDSHGTTYTYGTQELYIMIPNEETIKIAKSALKDLKNGKKLNDSYKEKLEVAKNNNANINGQ